MRLLKSAALATLLFGTCAASALAQVPVTIRDTVLVTADRVLLSDLFQNLPAGDEKAIAQAPLPGDRTVFDVNQLAALATANSVAWQARGSNDRVIVERGSRLIDASQLQRQLARLIADEQPGRDVEVDLDGRVQPIHMPIGGEYKIRFEDLWIDERGERVSVTVIAPSGDGRDNRVAVAGRLFSLTDVPVLARPVNSGEQVGDADIDWVKMRGGRVRQGTAMAVDQIVGRVPRRPLSAGVPLSLRDLQDRVLVAKGNLVTVYLRLQNMTLTTRGKALEDGARGNAVRIASSAGGRTIEASVIGPDVVEVHPIQPLTAIGGRR